MQRPILAAAAFATALTACLGRLERSDRTDARDRAADRVSGYAPGTNLRAESRPVAAVGLAVAARDAARADLLPIRPSDVTSAMIIRAGQANIEVDSLEPAVALVRTLARQLGGYIANTAMQTGRGQVRSATLEVKVPANRFDEGLSGLAPIGKLESVNVSAEDVGEEFTDATARMANARRLETRLIELIATRTGKLKDVLDVEQELARVREEIERYEGRLRYLQAHAALSTLTICVHEPPPVVGHPGSSVVAEAAKQAWRNFVWLFALVVQSLGIVIPLGTVATLGWVAMKRWRRGQAPRAAEA
ncbi:MAG: hypothetical protein AUF60_05125 [Gemmatimonadetes bacterium 13_1_20CM_69_28]|nr:MAG: hypothetical protein AUF60_05125 [Gemmatimonadetes bacterium 13_1_20CM_69_28]